MYAANTFATTMRTQITATGGGGPPGAMPRRLFVNEVRAQSGLNPPAPMTSVSSRASAATTMPTPIVAKPRIRSQPGHPPEPGDRRASPLARNQDSWVTNRQTTQAARAGVNIRSVSITLACGVPSPPVAATTQSRSRAAPKLTSRNTPTART